MTAEQCMKCKYQDWVTGFADGQDMFCCQKEGDPLMPFDMEDDTECPLFEEEEE